MSFHTLFTEKTHTYSNYVLREQKEQMEPERRVSLQCCVVWFHQCALRKILACSQATLHHLAWGIRDRCLAEALARLSTAVIY